MELISVIIPNYNYARFLKQRIDSVLNQTYTNIEVIILDDCSSDNSKEIIEQYRNNDRVTHIVYNEQNSGTTFKQWRKGFELAKGDFIWIAEADDYAAPTLLEELVSRMAADKDIKVGIVNSHWVLPDKTFINPDYTIPDEVRIYNGKDFVRQHLLKENYIYNASMAVFRRDALSRLSDEYMSFRSCGDKLFWKELSRQGKVLFVCKPLNYFRIHDSKVTTRSISSGLLFSEENRFYHMNIQDGTITNGHTRADVIKYFLRYIENVRPQLQSEDVYLRCRALWLNECDYRNSQLPFIFRVQCFLKPIV
jgi:glycosyltransferase involved in cell wall biosynthesis